VPLSEATKAAEMFKPYQHLFNTSAIKVASPFQWHYKLPDLNMDIVSKRTSLGSIGVASCFVICLRGMAKNHSPVLGMAHTSHLITFSKVLKLMKKEMCQSVAEAQTIQMYVIGGMLEGPKSESTSFDEQKEVLALAKKEKIVGVDFNRITNDQDPSALQVVLTPTAIYVTEKRLFERDGTSGKSF
jgi:hypothetical protein